MESVFPTFRLLGERRRFATAGSCSSLSKVTADATPVTHRGGGPWLDGMGGLRSVGREIETGAHPGERSIQVGYAPPVDSEAVLKAEDVDGCHRYGLAGGRQAHEGS
jgi:hypothetical protein